MAQRVAIKASVGDAVCLTGMTTEGDWNGNAIALFNDAEGNAWVVVVDVDHFDTTIVKSECVTWL